MSSIQEWMPSQNIPEWCAGLASPLSPSTPKHNQNNTLFNSPNKVVVKQAIYLFIFKEQLLLFFFEYCFLFFFQLCVCFCGSFWVTKNRGQYWISVLFWSHIGGGTLPRRWSSQTAGEALSIEGHFPTPTAWPLSKKKGAATIAFATRLCCWNSYYILVCTSDVFSTSATVGSASGIPSQNKMLAGDCCRIRKPYFFSTCMHSLQAYCPVCTTLPSNLVPTFMENFVFPRWALCSSSDATRSGWRKNWFVKNFFCTLEEAPQLRFSMF